MAAPNMLVWEKVPKTMKLVGTIQFINY